MSISGIGQIYYQSNVPTTKSIQNVNNAGKVGGFAGKITEKISVSPKTAEVDSNEVEKKTSAVLDRIGSQVPDEVKNAWMEAEKETGAFFTVYGMYITADGKHAHMTQMGIDRFVRWYRGEINPDDLLGNSVESAVKAVNKWIYDLEHPLAGQTAGSMEDRQLLMKEREFYDVFLNKLLQLSK